MMLQSKKPTDPGKGFFFFIKKNDGTWRQGFFCSSAAGFSIHYNDQNGKNHR